MYDNTNTQPDTTATSRRRSAVIALLLLLLLGVAGAVFLLRPNPGSSASGAGSAGGTSAVPGGAHSSTSGPASADPTTSPGEHGPSSGGGGGSSSDGGSHPGGGHAPRSAPAPAPAPALGIGAQVSGPEAYSGLCPASLEYAATVTVTRTPVDITYRWAGAPAGASRHAHLTALHTTLSNVISAAEGSGSASLQILAPVAIDSNVAHYTVACTHASAGTANVSPPAFSGDCSHGRPFTTTATITVTNGPVRVHYHWVRTDGASGPDSSVLVPAGTSTVTVTDTWTLYNGSTPSSAPFVGGEQLVLDSPFTGSSNTPEFSVLCI